MSHIIAIITLWLWSGTEPRISQMFKLVVMRKEETDVVGIPP